MKTPSEYYKELTFGSANPFFGARLKLKRAKRHLFEVQNTARELPVRQGRYILIGPKPEAGHLELIFMPQHLMPMEFAATVGDAIHNLRSAFDYVAVALTAPPLGRGNADYAYFPTGKDRKAFIKARDGWTPPGRKRIKGKMEGASTDALRIVEELEPYDGGKHSLRALHDLDIFDKHKLIVPAISSMTIDKLDVTIGEQRFCLGVHDFEANRALINYPGITRETKVQLDGDFHATFEIIFQQGQPLGGHLVVESLSELADTCEGFIEACEAHFLIRK